MLEHKCKTKWWWECKSTNTKKMFNAQGDENEKTQTQKQMVMRM
jgi:hypothetical protein